jgi:hypothetical protein
MKHDPDRGTGRTTSQIRFAPSNAIYVCKTHAFIRYCSDIAAKVGRKDLRFVCVEQVKSGYLRGLERPVVFDHDSSASYHGIRVA